MAMGVIGVYGDRPGEEEGTGFGLKMGVSSAGESWRCRRSRKVAVENRCNAVGLGDVIAIEVDKGVDAVRVGEKISDFTSIPRPWFRPSFTLLGPDLWAVGGMSVLN